MYEFETIVTYSQLDQNGRVPMYQILNHLQDASTFESESIGISFDYMTSMNKAWIMLAYKVRFLSELKLGDKITVGTSALDFGKVFCTRQFYIKDSKGNFVVQAESIWVVIEIDTRTAIRVDEDYCKGYSTKEAFEPLKVSRRVNVKGDLKEVGEFKILKAHIDSNGHMNNANYMLAVEEYVDSKGYNEICIAFNKEAMVGECLKVYESDNEGEKGIVLKNSEGEINAQIILSKK